MPTGYNYKRRIGAILRVGGAIVLFSQNGDEFLRKASILDVDVTNAGTAAVDRTLSVPLRIAVIAIFNAMKEEVAANFTVYISSKDQNDEAASATAAPLGMLDHEAAVTVKTFSMLRVRTNTSAQIRTRQSASAAGDIFRIATLGWIDRRGRDD